MKWSGCIAESGKTDVFGQNCNNVGRNAEMEKHADTVDISVLFFSLVVLIFWLYTHKLAKTAVLLALY